MAYFKWARDLSGNKTPQIMELPIASAGVVEKGECVLFTPGTGVASVVGTDFDHAWLGVAMEDHDGTTDGRQSGELIKVSVSPTAVYKLKSTAVITATGGSTSTFVVSGLLPQTDNLWIGSYLEVKTCAADSSLVGEMIPITDSTGSTGRLTFATQKSAFAAGDTAVLHPGKLAIGEYGWDLVSGNCDIDLDTSGGEAIILVDADPERKYSYWMARLSQFGNDAAAK